MRRKWCVLLGVMSLGAMAGCAPIAAVAYKVTGPPKLPADYKPANQPLLVFVENYENPDLYEVQSERIERDVADILNDNKAAPVVPLQKLLDLKSSRGEGFRKMDIPAVAKAVGAKQVVYVNLVRFSVTPPIGGDLMRGSAEALVKVIDDTGKTLWPLDSSVGRDIKFETPAVKLTFDETSKPTPDSTNPAVVQEQVYQKLTDRIASLFYDAPVDMVDGTEPQ